MPAKYDDEGEEWALQAAYNLVLSAAEMFASWGTPNEDRGYEVFSNAYNSELVKGAMKSDGTARPERLFFLVRTLSSLVASAWASDAKSENMTLGEFVRQRVQAGKLVGALDAETARKVMAQMQADRPPLR